MEDLAQLLCDAIEKGASDIHVVVGMPPLYRINTVLQPAEGFPPVTAEQTRKAVLGMVGDRRFSQFEEHRDLDFSVSIDGGGRFRVNAHYQRDTIAIAFRAIQSKVPRLGELGLPPVIMKLTELPRGLILVTGETGSGKSTTLAAMINEVNQKMNHHIITVEDPIEYELRSNTCVIEQRELGSDVPTFASGLKHALRQDPNVILVGEMRDLETTSAAITAAETGHLVLSTLHTQNASQTIERIVDIYPAEQQNQIRSMLSNTLQAVISQVLFKRQDRHGMVPACEVMLCTPAIRSCIRENRVHEIPNIIDTSRGVGMSSLDDSIKALVLNNQISPAQAIAEAVQPEQMRKALCA